MSRRITLGPVNRVEGELEVQLELQQGKIEAAYIKSTLYRGFENLLTGKDPLDALAITPRVCGICSVSQSVASARAIADLAGASMPANGERVTNIILATEVVADLLTHFYLFFLPDFASPAYRGRPWYDEAARRFTAVKGERYGGLLKARAELLHIMGVLAGKWPHSMVFQPGGVTNNVSLSEQLKLQGILSGFRNYLEAVLFGDRLETIAGLDSVELLQQWRESRSGSAADLPLWLSISDDLALHQAGAGYNRFLAFPAYSLAGNRIYPGGVWLDGQIQSLDTASINEHLGSAWLEGDIQHPAEGSTRPLADKAEAYTWCKAPRYQQLPMETGSLARQLLAGDPLAGSLINDGGSQVHSRILMRLIEMAKLVIQMERWVRKINPKEPFCLPVELPSQGQGVGLTEAARGSLGHWLSVENGVISNYQLIAPTSWNFSPRDNNAVPGPLEFALQGIDYESPTGQLRMQHVIRSFDPCMVCTVH
ncbi:HupV protein [Motiliproteus coralliicola]|uniref:HupV protein n=1 Tax=Motiliproteus coralliicola TaxID=2283196 RepID=A0A369WES7_9GAMM|nr:nickel-dependent hydrogenase large subunit [Motiliproteus coralliicola]RDE19851.1 HupV protein [Motiliproteus coralliicola]